MPGCCKSSPASPGRGASSRSARSAATRRSTSPAPCPTGGRLVTLEAVPKHAEVARANLARAGLADRVEVIVGPALATLPGLDGPFDFIFIDADKESNPAYLAQALRLARPGTVIVCDNVVRDGRVADLSADSPAVAGTRRFFEQAGAEPRLTATAVQTVGVKGWDGFAIAIVDG